MADPSLHPPLSQGEGGGDAGTENHVSGPDRLEPHRTEGAAGGADRDFAQALRALARCRRLRRWLRRDLVELGHWDHDEAVNDGGNDDERHDRVDQLTVAALAVL